MPGSNPHSPSLAFLLGKMRAKDDKEFLRQPKSVNITRGSRGTEENRPRSCSTE